MMNILNSANQSNQITFTPEKIGKDLQILAQPFWALISLIIGLSLASVTSVSKIIDHFCTGSFFAALLKTADLRFLSLAVTEIATFAALPLGMFFLCVGIAVKKRASSCNSHFYLRVFLRAFCCRATLVIFLVMSILGFSRSVFEQFCLKNDPFSGLDGFKAVVTGSVTESPKIKGKGRASFVLQTDSAVFNNNRSFLMPEEYQNNSGNLSLKNVNSPILVRAQNVTPLTIGQTVKINGTLKPIYNSYKRSGETPAWVKYYHSKGIYHVLQVPKNANVQSVESSSIFFWAYLLRKNIQNVFQGKIDKTSESLLLGIMLGEASLLDEKLAKAFQESGTTHLLAASGLNVGIIAGVSLYLGSLFKLNKRLSQGISAINCFIYMVMLGFAPSIVRATVMAYVILAVVWMGRRTDLPRTLAVSGILLLFWQPMWLGNISFQLSYFAVWGIALWYPVVYSRLSFLPKWLNCSLSLSLSVNILLAPLLLFYFKSFASAGFVANILMTPAAEFLLPLGGIVALLLFVCEPLAIPFLLLAKVICAYLIWMAQLLPSIMPLLPCDYFGLSCTGAYYAAILWLYVLSVKPFRNIKRNTYPKEDCTENDLVFNNEIC